MGIATDLGKGEAAHAAQLNPQGWPFSSVCTAATNGALCSAPRPRFPGRSPPQVGVIDFDAPGEPLSLVALVHDLQSLCLSFQAVL